MEQIVKDVMRSCDMTEAEARQEIRSEVDNILSSDNITYEDLEDVCMNLGVDFDNIEGLLEFMC